MASQILDLFTSPSMVKHQRLVGIWQWMGFTVGKPRHSGRGLPTVKKTLDVILLLPVLRSSQRRHKARVDRNRID